VLGFPRIGRGRELKTALESYWRGDSSEHALDVACNALRERNWAVLKDAGINYIPSNDFSLYDHVLDTTIMLGSIPTRFRSDSAGLDQYFRMARGQAQGDVGNEGVDALGEFMLEVHSHYGNEFEMYRDD
jgi:5-methyltetrahydropteroyltriglutamate--homocysteine methyltransferase